jgi:hypothetical protein
MFIREKDFHFLRLQQRFSALLHRISHKCASLARKIYFNSRINKKKSSDIFVPKWLIHVSNTPMKA